MDDPGWSWPAWKFGMKRGDLFTKLHDQYNTLPTPIQDPEAFHHDVYEISNRARSKDEFHLLLAERKEHRLEELNAGLELASVKIISNPNLIGTEQWPLAIQLFRARSLDALVRYFSSYLPEVRFDSDTETLDTNSINSDMSRSSTTSISTTPTDENSEVPSTGAFFVEKQALTHEPLTITTNVAVMSPVSHRKAPISPPPSHAGADSAAASPIEVESQHDDEFVLNHPSPASRSMSFSGSESDRFPPYHHDDLPSGANTPSSLDDTESEHGIYEHDTPCGDPAEIEPELSQRDDTLDEPPVDTFPPCDLSATAQAADTESDTPTPRPEINQATSYMSTRLAAHFRRSPSPYTRTRLAQCEVRKSSRMRKREQSPQLSRSPCEVLSRVQKALPDQMRCRSTRGRKRMEVE